MKSLIWKLSIFEFISGFVLIYPVYSVFLKDSGMDNFHISILLIIWGASHFVLEVPTGSIADKYSRRNIMIYGGFIQAFGFLIWFLDQSFWGFALGFILWGIRFALVSGAYDSFIFDELKSINQDDKYEKIKGRLRATSSIGVGLALALGGFASQYISYNFTVISSIITSILSSLILLTIRPTAIYQRAEINNYWKFLRETFGFITKHLDVKKIIIITSVVLGIYGTADEMFGLVLKNLGISLGFIGILYAVTSIISSLANLASPYVLKNNQKPENILLIITAIFWLVMGIFPIKLLTICYFVAIFFIGIMEIKTNTRLQTQINSHQRATILSINSLICELVFIFFTLGVGLFSKYFNLISTIFIPGGIILLLLVLFFYKQDSVRKVAARA